MLAHGLRVGSLQELQLPGLEHKLNSCGAWASLRCTMCDLPGPGIRPMSPALAGGFFTPEPRGKPS